MTTLGKTIFLLVVVSSFASPTTRDVGKDSQVAAKQPNSFMWNNYKSVALTTGLVIAGIGLATLMVLAFPIYAYKACYALGGCQSTLDNYIDGFIGEQSGGHKLPGVVGETRRVKRSTLDDAEIILERLRKGVEKFADEDFLNEIQSSNEQQIKKIKKRAPLDYIEPILVMASKAYNEYIDPELKKNFEKTPSIR